MIPGFRLNLLKSWYPFRAMRRCCQEKPEARIASPNVENTACMFVRRLSVRHVHWPTSKSLCQILINYQNSDK